MLAYFIGTIIMSILVHGLFPPFWAWTVVVLLWALFIGVNVWLIRYKEKWSDPNVDSGEF